MKILYFTRDYTTHDRRFLAKLVETEHEVYYLQLERRGPLLETRDLPAGIRRVRWAGGRQRFRPALLPYLLAGLRHAIQRVQPDLIQAGPIQTAAYLVALSGFHPLVSVSWGSDLLRDAGRTRWHRTVTRFTLERSDALVGDCEPVREAAIAHGMNPEKIITFPWGVDIHHFNVGTFQCSNVPTFTILSTRSWEPVYGVDVLARGFVIAAQECPELRLTMLGGGSQAALLSRIFTAGGVLDRVRFAGQVSQADLPDVYRSADLYVSASRSDGTSISLLEAMACGRPALVSDIPGNRAWVKPGVQGWWFRDGDAGDLARCLVRAAASRQRLPEMGRAARRLAEERADWDRNFPGLLQAYALALRGRA